MSLHENKSFLPTLSQQAGQVFGPLQREIDRVFADFNRGLAQFDMSGISPSMDFRETRDAVEIKIDVPGISEKDLAITVDDDVLTISGEKKSERDDQRHNYHVVERGFGAFSRSVKLPRGVDAEKFSAVLKDGVLTVSAPKAAASSERTIRIEAKS